MLWFEEIYFYIIFINSMANISPARFKTMLSSLNDNVFIISRNILKTKNVMFLYAHKDIIMLSEQTMLFFTKVFWVLSNFLR